MVDAGHLDRARAVYTDENGVTRVSPDLQLRPTTPTAQDLSMRPRGLRMAVSETLPARLSTVIVEGPSDQHYLSAIKNFLVGLGVLRPSREIVFMPAGGVKASRPSAHWSWGRDDALTVRAP